MKLIDVALKDLSRSFRSAMFLVFGFALPVLTSALFYFAFSGLATGGGFDLPVTQVQVANLDKGQAGFSGGELLTSILKNAMPDLVQVTQATDPATARSAVDRQNAAVVVIIPSGFTAAIMNPGGRAAVELYQDPTLTIGPAIVKGLVSQIVDGMAGSKIAAVAAHDQMAAQGMVVDAVTLQTIATQYANWAAGLSRDQSSAPHPLFDLQPPAGSQTNKLSETAITLGLITAGMMVFYVFFTAAASAQSILLEEEAGTLPRLFTTPTPVSSILGGKFVATFLLLIVQVVVLVVATALIFGIDWGEPLAVALAVVGMVVLAAGFGIFITSLLRNTRQGGIIYGGVMTVLGMIGVFSAFAGHVPGVSNAISRAALVSPHGWAVRGWQLLLQGAGVGELWPTVVVMVVAGAVFFAMGVLRFRKRYAKGG
jgi:linearmycin/streptolysin S transport system permease protein